MVAGFIAVHSGAGFFSSENRKCILTACKQAALVGVEWLKRGETAVEASCAATAILEDHPATNAGLGANLTSAESVELDATVMDGETLDFGSVGAIPNVKNPIMVAQAVLNLRKQPNALVPPSLIVGPEGTEFAKLHGIPTVSNSSLVTASSLKSYRKSLALVNRAYSQSSPSDTVGVICLSPDLMTSATSSSGGPLLKLPGRVGAAATFGAASWADVVHDGSGNVMKAIAISASGCGECLIRTNFATNFAETIMKPPKNATDLPLLSYEAEKYLRTFVKSRHLGRFEERDKVAGFICLLFDRSEKQAELIWAHNTQHFCVAYMSTCDTKPKCFISTGKTNGEICVSGVKIKL